MNSLLEKEVITPRLGGSTDVLLIYGQLFSSSENGPSWVVTFQSEKWSMISDGRFHLPVQKMVHIGRSFT
jgi:hypothetical protein